MNTMKMVAVVMIMAVVGCESIIPGAGVDNDSDGVMVGTDCNDNDASVYPEAPDWLGDGVDQNCDGVDGVGDDDDDSVGDDDDAGDDDGDDDGDDAVETVVLDCTRIEFVPPSNWEGYNDVLCSTSPTGLGLEVNVVGFSGVWAANNGWPSTRCQSYGDWWLEGWGWLDWDLVSWESWYQPDPASFTAGEEPATEGGCSIHILPL